MQAATLPPPPLPMTAEEALRLAETEGLTLLKANNVSGYKGVYFNSSVNRAKPYRVKVTRGGIKVQLGYFATAEEAALCYARASAAKAAAAAAAPPAPPPMTAKEAVRQAEAEGLELLKADTVLGYKGVGFNSKPNLTKPYQAQAQRGGKKVHLGYFVTVEEAALAFAREAAAPAASSRKRKAKPLAEPEEEQEDAEDDGVEVVVLDAYELFQPVGRPPHWSCGLVSCAPSPLSEAAAEK